jgi:hypothetical protein
MFPVRERSEVVIKFTHIYITYSAAAIHIGFTGMNHPGTTFAVLSTTRPGSAMGFFWMFNGFTGQKQPETL